jgi:DNA polymerase/3'-5' exonuclease PolX
MTNADIATRLRAHANELSAAGDNLYRVRAVRRAALAVLALPTPADRPSLQRAGVGKSLAETITHFADTGEWKPAGATRSARSPHG